MDLSVRFSSRLSLLRFVSLFVTIILLLSVRFSSRLSLLLSSGHEGKSGLRLAFSPLFIAAFTATSACISDGGIPKTFSPLFIAAFTATGLFDVSCAGSRTFSPLFIAAFTATLNLFRGA